MITRCCSIICIVTLLLLPSLQAATYEVARENPRASDDGPGTAEQPFKTIAKAVSKVGAGDVIIIHSGTYREDIAIKTTGTEQSPLSLQAAPSEHVVLTGADVIKGWQRTEDARPIYRVAWPHKFLPWSRAMTHPGDEFHQLIGRCEQVFVDGYTVRQTLAEPQLAPGSFYVDVTNKTLSVWDSSNRDLNRTHVEASVRSRILSVEGSYVHIRGLHFRYAANAAQHGAVELRGDHNTLEDCVIEQMNSSGAAITGPNHVIRRCVFRDNGQLGFGASGAHYLLLTECVVENNNAKGFSRGWEAGGDKLCLCKEAVLEKSQFIRNRGVGVWFDIGNTNCIVRQCLIADNEDAGIFYEISFALHATDNVIVNNGFANTDGAWGAQAGIVLSSSPYAVIERNILAGNREGFNFREQNRTTPTIEDRHERAVWNHDQLIRNNIIAFNRDAQIWGWFDMPGTHHWPVGSQSAAAETTPKPANMAADYLAKDDSKLPKDLTLEKLAIRFEKNFYFGKPGQGMVNWGAAWGRNKKFPTVQEFQSELKIDSGSETFEPRFKDVLCRDFSLPTDTMVHVKDSYPRGPVPGVTLGISN